MHKAHCSGSVDREWQFQTRAMPRHRVCHTLQIGALPWPAFERYHCLCLEQIESEEATAIASASRTARVTTVDPSEPGPTAPDDSLPGGATQVTGMGQPAGAARAGAGASAKDAAAPKTVDDPGGELPADDDVDMDIDTDAPTPNGTLDAAEELPPPLPKSHDRCQADLDLLCCTTVQDTAVRLRRERGSWLNRQ